MARPRKKPEEIQPAGEQPASAEAAEAEEGPIAEKTARTEAPEGAGEAAGGEEAAAAEPEAPEPDVVAETGAGEPAAEEPAPKETPKRVRKPVSARPTTEKRGKAAETAKRPATRAKRQAAVRKPIVRTPRAVARPRGRLKERRGIVVSSAMDKTIVVRVEAVKPHPRYKKVVRRSTRFHAHDEANSARVGDLVRIVASRPLSKTKTWRLAEILKAAE